MDDSVVFMKCFKYWLYTVCNTLFYKTNVKIFTFKLIAYYFFIDEC